MHVPRNKFSRPLIDVFLTASHAAQGTMTLWHDALMRHVARVADIIIESPSSDADTRVLLGECETIDELLAMGPECARADRLACLSARRALLQLMAHIPRRPAVSPSTHPPTRENKEFVHEASIGKNKEVILNFIRRSDRARVKDVIDGIQGLSGRTIKRNLKELIQRGLVQKRLENRVLYYFAIDLN